MRKGWRVLAALLALVAAALFVVVVVQARMLLKAGWTVPVGNVAEWVAALGGFGTVGTLIVAWTAFRRDQAQRASDDKARQDDEERRQAELVTGWLEDHIEAGLGPDNRRHYVVLYLVNASHGVVYDVFVRVNGEPQDPVSVGGAAPEHREARGYLHALPPKTSKLMITMPDITHSVKGLEVYFRDARNRRWMRDSFGELKRSSGDPFPVVRDAFWSVKRAPLTQPEIEIQVLSDISSNDSVA